jgi:alpha-galactosidase
MTVHVLRQPSSGSRRAESEPTEVWLDDTTGVPTILHWGAPLSAALAVAVASDPLVVARTFGRQAPQNMMDVEAPLSIVPEHGSGFPGRAGLLGHRRGGSAWAPRFRLDRVEQPSPGHAVFHAVDPIAELSLAVSLRLAEALTVTATVTNSGTTRYLLDGLAITMPVPGHASELLSFDGRWVREMQPHRHQLISGTWQSENIAGRTSHDHQPTVFLGTPSFGEWTGHVWGAHLAWSGNHRTTVDVLPDGRRYLQMGELLHPGEVCLERGESYSTPELICCHSSAGLTPATWQFHRSLRVRASHPVGPRPVLINTWEAVYFNHDLDRLKHLADVAATVGIERFVLDDGWFGGRRDDHRGLGDWWVSADAHPNGLTPLIEHVRGLGMEFGIWVEPEMVNPDSDLYRAHPDWALDTDGYEPVLSRHQLVLDIAHPDAYEYILGHLDSLLGDHDIAYVKWDMNRNHAGGSGASGAAGTHAQTRAVYRLLDELRARHPSVEIESCASGGARMDHEILRRTVRVWASDCNDALERQTIQQGTSMLIPHELVGAHIGPTQSHTTGRVHSLAFRVATALFGHLGVEWDVTELSDREREQLAEAIALHKRFRPLLHSGDVVRFDVAANGQRDGAAVVNRVHGVYAVDRREALIAYAQLATGGSLIPPRLLLPGLDAEALYQLRQVPLPDARVEWPSDGVTLTGGDLATIGIQPPRLHPESAVLIHVVAVAEEAPALPKA